MRINEIIKISLHSIKGNKLRTMLTVLGVVVGIFSIIVIMTIITMLQDSIQNGFSQLGQNTFQIQKFPAIMAGGPGAWLKYRNRKDITLDDYYRLKNMLQEAQYVGAEQWEFGKVIKYGSKETNPNIEVGGITAEAFKTNNWSIASGREIRALDVNYSNDVCDIGQDVVDKLFPNIDPVGQYVRVDGLPLKVIGVLDKQPSLFGSSRDNNVIMPITTFESKYGKYGKSVNITVMSYSKEDYNATIDAAIGYMRTIRKVEPGKDNDFDIYSNDSLISQVNDITGGVKIGAMAVSIIALIAAGVGIMNIMLVSVTERTREIGIRKAIGARRSTILAQFLIEAITLCMIGGVIGIALGVGVGNLAGSQLNAQMAIPVDWVFIGFSLCILVGVIFGTYPAYKAANMDPIEALRYE
ncbi:MAG: ABC transporter permease [Ignavibacteriaceae bacterium]